MLAQNPVFNGITFDDKIRSSSTQYSKRDSHRRGGFRMRETEKKTEWRRQKEERREIYVVTQTDLWRPFIPAPFSSLFSSRIIARSTTGVSNLRYRSTDRSVWRHVGGAAVVRRRRRASRKMPRGGDCHEKRLPTFRLRVTYSIFRDAPLSSFHSFFLHFSPSLIPAENAERHIWPIWFEMRKHDVSRYGS